MKAVERFRIPAGVPGRMCPAAVRTWEELSHAVYRASTLLRSPPTRPCNVCPSGVAQQPLAGAVVIIPLQIGPRACSRNEMRLVFRKHLPAILPFPQATLPFPQSSRRSNVHGSHLRWQVQTRCAPVQTSSARTLRAPPAPSRSVRADSSVRMLQGLPINNAPATRKGRCRTGASRVCRYQDGESLIRIADRDSDRCKPITSST